MIVVSGDAVMGKTTFLERILEEASDLMPLDFQPGEPYEKHAAVECSLVRGYTVVVKEVVNKEVFSYRAYKLRSLESLSVRDSLDILNIGFTVLPKLVVFIADGPKRDLIGTPYYDILYDVLDESAEDAAILWRRGSWKITSRITFVNLLATLSNFMISQGKRAHPVDVLLISDDDFYDRIEYLSNTHKTPISVTRVSLEEAIEKVLELISSRARLFSQAEP